MFTGFIYKSLLPFSFLFSIAAIIISLKYIKKKTYSYFFHYLFCADGILIGKTIEFFAKTENLVIVTGKITYALIAFSGVFWILFINQWTHKKTWILSKNFVILLCIIPIITIILQSTNNIHHLVWKEHHFEQQGKYIINVITKYGPWFYVHSIYSYGLFAYGCIILCIENAGLWKQYKVRTLLIILGISCPVFLSLFYVFRDKSEIFWDFSAGSYAITSFLLSIVFIKYDFFTLPQPSRNKMINIVPFGILALTQEGIIIDVTKVATEHLGTNKLIGQNISSFLKNDDNSDFMISDMQNHSKVKISTLNGKQLNVEITEHIDNNKISAYVLVTQFTESAKNQNVKPEDLYNAIYEFAVEAHFSKRELEVLKELLGTDTNKIIAEKLKVSAETIHTHVSRILKKLNCKNRNELRELALKMLK